MVVDDDDANHESGTSATRLVPEPRVRLDRQPAVEQREALAHPGQADAAALLVLCVESVPVVLDERASPTGPRRTSRTLTRRAPACLAMFVSDSCTIRYRVVSTSDGKRSSPSRDSKLDGDAGRPP